MYELHTFVLFYVFAVKMIGSVFFQDKCKYKIMKLYTGVTICSLLFMKYLSTYLSIR